MKGTRFWQRFFKQRPAILALGFIVLLTLVALFAYPLSPDDAPDAHTLQVELAAREPGFSLPFVRVYKPNAVQSVSWLNYLLHGQEKNYVWVPIHGTPKMQGDSVIVQQWMDDNLFERVAFSQQQLHVENNQVKIYQRTFYLGTDRYGRDMLSRLLLGTRISLAVGWIAVLLSLSIGVLLGALSGYLGGFTDALISWLIQVIWAIPTLLLVFAITFVLGKGFWQIFIAVGLTMWVGTARLIRGQVLTLRELDYVKAASIMGFSLPRIIVFHLAPNLLGPTLVLAAGNFATAILIEAGLSFLGIGVQPPTASWGLMIKENYNFIITNRPLLALIPGFAIMFTVLAFNILGNALRDAMDVNQ
ncbi:MAG: ABC transporter permease [Chitinophagaceae bacterium]